MKKYTEHIKFIALAIVVVFLYGFASHRNTLEKIKGIKIDFKNNDRLFISYKTVDNLLIQSFEEGRNQSKEKLNLNNVEEYVEDNQMIADAEVFQTINGDLGVLITQRIPVLRVANNLESYYYDKQGEKMPLSFNYSARVPLTTSNLDKDNSKDIILLANRIKNDAFLRKQIIGIHQIEKKEAIHFELKTRLGNQTIIFGDLKRMESKIKNLKVFYQKTMSDGSLNNYKTINLKFENQVVCAKK